jgi:hypothetical protein
MRARAEIYDSLIAEKLRHWLELCHRIPFTQKSEYPLSKARKNFWALQKQHPNLGFKATDVFKPTPR